MFHCQHTICTVGLTNSRGELCTAAAASVMSVAVQHNLTQAEAQLLGGCALPLCTQPNRHHTLRLNITAPEALLYDCQIQLRMSSSLD